MRYGRGAMLSSCALLTLLSPGTQAKNDAFMWVLSYDNTTSGWSTRVKSLASSTADGVTGISISAYQIFADGSLGYAPKNGIYMEKLGIVPLHAAAPNLAQYPCITAASYDDVRSVIGNSTHTARFVSAAVDKMQLLGLKGYNLDLEFGGSAASDNSVSPALYRPCVSQEGAGGSRSIDHVFLKRALADERLFLVFVNALATALHAVGGQLSSDIDWCGGLEHGLHRDYMGMQCGEYKGSKIDSVAMMKTYDTHNLADFERYVKDAQRSLDGLGSKLRVGVDVATPENQVAGMFDVLTNRSIEKLAIWHCDGSYPASGCYNPTFQLALRKWAKLG